MRRTEDRAVVWALAATAAVGLWLCAAMPVFAQEAYYWACGRHPALSYLDHPPIAPWGIAAGSALLGDGPLGIRAATLLATLATTLVGLRLVSALGGDGRARLAWVALRLGVPLFAGQHFFASPDAPLGLFWLATVLALWRARAAGALRWWLAAGACAGLALASKYTAAFLLPGGVLVLLLDPALRPSLRRPGPYVALAVAALCFLPVVLWNARHGWVSFLFQTAGRAEGARFELDGFVEAALLQLGVVFPTTLVAFGAAAVWLGRRWRRERDPRGLWLLAFGLPLPLFLAAASTAVQVKVNWLLPAYGPLAVGAALWWSESRIAVRRPRTARALAGAVAVLAAGTVLAPAVDLLPQGASKHPSWSGWEEVTGDALGLFAELEDRGAEGRVFLLAPDHRDAAQLAWRAWRAGGTGRRAFATVVAQDAFGRDGRQWGLWSPAADRVGHDAVFVLARPAVRAGFVDEVRARFERVERAFGTVAIRRGRPVLDADVYRCTGYRGPPAGP